MNRIKKLWIVLICSVIMLLTVSKLCLAEEVVPFLQRRDYGIGWQYSKPASGLSVKLPIDDAGYVQPILSFAVKEEDGISEQHYAVGIRGIYDFPVRYGFKPYAGLSLGYSEKNETTADNRGVINGGTGYEAFFGVEYQKYLLRPALEIGMGGYRHSDQSFYAGVTFNFSLLYYF